MRWKVAGELDTAVDFLAWELRPAALDDLGLAAALPRYVEEWSARYGIAAHFRAERVQSGMLSREAEVTFYRIAQEALTNVLKHAHAERVDLLLEARDDAVVMVIEDNGVGFDPMDGSCSTTVLDWRACGNAQRSSARPWTSNRLPGAGRRSFSRCPLATGVQEAM
jgi:signal transduction histidine kinase